MAETEVLDAPSAPAPGTPPVVPPVAPPPAPPSVPPDWVSTLADEALRGDKTLHQYKTPEDAYRGLVETKKLLGVRTEGMVRLPPKDAKLDSPEVKAYREAAGIPLSVDGYKDVKIPETAAGTMSSDGVKAFTENVALPSGMSTAQVQQAVNFLAEWNSQQMGAIREKWIADQAPLRQQWGRNFAREVGLAARATVQLEQEAGLSPEYFKTLGDMGFNEHPDHIKLWAWVGRNLFERNIIPGHVEGSLTQDEIKSKMTAIRADKAHAFNIPGHKGHQAAIDEMEGLLKAAYGTKEVTTG